MRMRHARHRDARRRQGAWVGAIVIASFVLPATPLRAQVSAIRFGGAFPDAAYGVTATLDGGALVVGEDGVGSFVDRSMALRLDDRGAVVWEESLDEGSGFERFHDAVEIPGIGFAVVGSTVSRATFLYLDPAGNVLWHQHSDDPFVSLTTEGTAVALDTAGNVVFAGGEGSCFPPCGGGPGYTAFVDAYDGLGVPQLSRSLTSAGGGGGTLLPQRVRHVRPTADGGLFVLGEEETCPGCIRPYGIRLDASGVELWHLGLTETGMSQSHLDGAVETPGGGFLVAGGREVPFTQQTQAWLLEVDAAGTVLWEKVYAGSGASAFQGLVEVPGGGAVAAGFLVDAGGFGGADLWVVKVDGSGTVLWQRALGGGGADYAWDLDRTVDGGFVVVGQTDSFGSGDQDAWIVELDAQGGGCPTSRATAVQPSAVTTAFQGFAKASVRSEPRIAGAAATTTQASAVADCMRPDPTVQPVGAHVGGTLSFQAQMSCCPLFLAMMASSLTGGTQTWTLPGDVTLFLDVDAWTLMLLSFPSVSIVTLDGSGAGGTAPIPIPNNPSLSGLPLWVAAAAWNPAGGGFLQGTATVPFALQ